MGEHRRRGPWPEPLSLAEDMSALSVTGEHTHEVPRSIRRRLLAHDAFFLILVLMVTLGAIYLYQDHEYVVGRGQYRDAEAVRAQERTTEQIRAAICGLLDGLPAGPVLDPKREQYDCGPGVPTEQLTPEQLDQLQRFASGIDAPAEPSPIVKPRQAPQDELPTPTPSPSAPAPAAPPQEPTGPPASAPGLPPAQAPAGPTPAPSPSAPPLVDLNPITDPLCTALGICA